MAEIKDCMNKKVKISKGSITIKDDDNKTCGVVRNIVSLYDLQANKQIPFSTYAILCHIQTPLLLVPSESCFLRISA